MRRALIVLIPVAAFAGCGSGDDEDATTAAQQTTPPPATQAAEAAPAAKGPVRTDGDPKVTTYASGLDAPWELAFLPDGRALVTERPGNVKIVSKGGKRSDAGSVEVEAVGEGGLLGLALDPDFEDNKRVYLYRTTGPGNVVSRHTFDGKRISGGETVVEGIEAGAIHDGGRIHFGPDGKLYISTGDAGNDVSAQQDGKNGKILRWDPRAGGEPEVYSTGHRNPQGFDWMPRTKTLIENEHGPDGDDEVNVLRKGANYGWPDVRGEQKRSGFTPPVAIYPESIAPSGSTFVRKGGSKWSGDYLIGALVGEQIRRVRVSKNGKVSVNEPLFEGRYGRIRTVVEGPDGALYALTNNTDGRGSPKQGDDRVLRIVPPRG